MISLRIFLGVTFVTFVDPFLEPEYSEQWLPATLFRCQVCRVIGAPGVGGLVGFCASLKEHVSWSALQLAPLPSPAVLALSGRGDADFHADVNFAFTEFSEVRHGCAKGSSGIIVTPVI